MTDAPVAARTRHFAPSRLFHLLNEGQKHDAIDLALGIPEAPRTPPELLEYAWAAMRAGKNQYEAPDGNFELRRQIARRLTVPTDPATELTITAGGTEALSIAVLSTVDPGDEVIVFEPVYENFLNAIALVGGTPRLVRLRAPEWSYDIAELRAAFGPRTRAIVVNSPNNPTGHILTYDELAEIAELCERWNSILISDEIYAAYTFGGHRHVSAAEPPALRERSMAIGSLSKSHAVSGWRLGYLRASAALTAVARRVHGAVSAGTASPLQEAAARAFASDPDFGTPGEDLRAQRDKVIGLFGELGIHCIPPDGGCYVMADIRPFTDEDCESFAYRLVAEARVMVAPGRYFYTDSGRGGEFIRIAFNKRLDLLDDVGLRLAQFGPKAASRRTVRS
jgi:N-succinyldiaminopimelate aminotransferase